MNLPTNFQQRLIQAISQRGVQSQCEFCRQNNWAIFDKAVGLPISDLTGNIVIPSPQIPAAAMICNNCGNIRFFALGALGLLPTAPSTEAK